MLIIPCPLFLRDGACCIPNTCPLPASGAEEFPPQISCFGLDYKAFTPIFSIALWKLDNNSSFSSFYCGKPPKEKYKKIGNNREK